VDSALVPITFDLGIEAGNDDLRKALLVPTYSNSYPSIDIGLAGEQRGKSFLPTVKAEIQTTVG
jgi:hypothetical protein